MNDPLNICLPCGICCDGTMIGFVELGKEESLALTKIMDIEEAGGNGFILQSCNSFSDKCNIYLNRPKQCANFNCGLLKSVENNELEFDSAIEIIKEIKKRKEDIEQKLALPQLELKSKSFYFKMVELNILLNRKESESSLMQSHLELRSELNQLNSLLLKNFDVSFFRSNLK